MSDDLRRGPHDPDDEPPPGGPVPHLVPRRARPARAVRVVVVGAASTAAVLGGVLAVQALPSRDDVPSLPPAVARRVDAEPAPARTAASTPTPTSAPTPIPERTEVPAPVPPLVAVTASGDVVTLDAATGERLATLHTGIALDDTRHVDVTTDPARGAVLVSHVPSTGEREILRIPLGGGEPEVVGHGWHPLVSPDGRLLFAAASDPATGGSALAVTDLATGDVRYLPQVDVDRHRFLRPLAWTPDGTALYLTLGVEGYSCTYTLPVTASSLDEAVLVEASVEPSWRTAETLGSALLAVAAQEPGPEPAIASLALLLVDRVTGARVDEIDGGRGLGVRDLVATSDGGLVVLGAPGRGDGTAHLYRWDGSEGLRLLGEGFVGVGR